MRKNGLLPVLLVLILLLAVYVGHSEGHTPAKSLMPEMPVDGGVFLLLSAILIYGGKALYRKD